MQGGRGKLWSVGLVPDTPVAYSRPVGGFNTYNSAQEFVVPGVNSSKVGVCKSQGIQSVT